jgi:hypothetical protein
MGQVGKFLPAPSLACQVPLRKSRGFYFELAGSALGATLAERESSIGAWSRHVGAEFTEHIPNRCVDINKKIAVASS